MTKTRKEKLEEIFYANATMEERLAYDLKKTKKQVNKLENLPVETVEKEIVKEVTKEVENSVTGESIVQKINELEIVPEKQVDFQHIKNFPWHLTKGQSDGGVGFMGYGAYDINIKAITLGQITANQNNYATGLGSWFRISSDAARSITGFENGTDGRGFLITNVGSFAITLEHQDASSAASNRILCESGSDIVLAANDTAWLLYDVTTERWRVVLHSVGGGGSGLNKETPTGAINDSNVTFTVSNQPFFINVNGGIYEEGDGIYASYAGGTITLNSPVGTGGFIKSYYS